ncbi:hypothetical protein D3C87_1911630 [compost metagenome]
MWFIRCWACAWSALTEWDEFLSWKSVVTTLFIMTLALVLCVCFAAILAVVILFVICISLGGLVRNIDVIRFFHIIRNLFLISVLVRLLTINVFLQFGL